MRVLGCSAVVLSLLCSPCAADGLAIDHSAAGCIVAGQFPRLTARIDPTGDVARASIYFRAGGTLHWYSVEMRPEAGAFSGVLPMLKKSTRSVDYYIEVMDRAFAPSRTAEHHPEVVEAAAACRKEAPVAAMLAESRVVVGAAPGAPPLPPGFVGQGLIAAGVAAGVAGAAAAGAGGGVSTAALVLGAAGIVGAGAAVAVAAGGGDSGGASGAEAQETYAGPFSGQRTLVSTGRDAGGAVISTCSWTSAISGTVTLTLARQPNGTLSGTAESTVTETEITRSCGSPSGQSFMWTCQVAGTPGQLGCRAQRDVGFQTNTLELAGALSGQTLSGSFTYTTGGSNSGGGQTFTHSGSTVFPLALTRR